ncbi:adenylyl cyclase alpha, putative, partial [Hepatocystis sp. ex Piliocolobus tephrosceles]
MMQSLTNIYTTKIISNKKLKNFFFKCRPKKKVLYSFTSRNKLYLNESIRCLYRYISFLYLFFVIFCKDILYINVDRKYDKTLDMFIMFLICWSCLELVLHLLMKTFYTFHFIFFDIISIILLVFDLFVFERHMFDFFCYLTKSIYNIKEISIETIFYLVQLFKALKVTKIYSIIIKLVHNRTKQDYKHRNEWNFEKMESMKRMKTLKESLKFTNKVHLTIIRRYFMSIFFILLSYIFIEMISTSKYNHNSMDYFVYNLDIVSFDDYYETEFLKALYYYSTIQKSNDTGEYLISFKSKKKLKNFTNKKEINLKGNEHVLWDFTNLYY